MARRVATKNELERVTIRTVSKKVAFGLEGGGEVIIENPDMDTVAEISWGDVKDAAKKVLDIFFPPDSDGGSKDDGDSPTIIVDGGSGNDTIIITF